MVQDEEGRMKGLGTGIVRYQGSGLGVHSEGCVNEG
jgi:hypothetical protein